MDAKQLAETYAYEFYNDADHLARLSENVRAALAAGDFADALENLRIAGRPAQRIEMRVRDAERAIAEAQRAAPTPTAQPAPPQSRHNGGEHE